MRKTVRDQLQSTDFKRLPYAEQLARQQQVLEELQKHYPRQAEPYTLWIAAVKEDALAHPEALTALQKEYSARAAEHPDDALALYVAAHALIGSDTPQSLRLLQKAETLAPRFPEPALDLAQIYSMGKFSDKAKFSEELTKYWTACPASDDRNARWMLVKNPELQAKVATALRPMLERSRDPELLKSYEFLWGLEFRTASPQQFPELRQRVAADVKRLQAVNRHPDAEWTAMLIGGNRQAEMPPAETQQQEDALVAAYPHSQQAEQIRSKRWNKEHRPPTDQKDTAAWTAYHQAQWDFQQKMMEQFPDTYWPAAYYRLVFIPQEIPVTEKQGVAMATEAMRDVDSYLQPAMRSFGYETGADNLLYWGFAPQMALDEMQKAEEWQKRAEVQYRAQDDHSDADIQDHEKQARMMQRYFDGELLQAAMRANRADAAASIRAEVDAPLAADDKDATGYWLNRARLAAVEGQQQDALAYYQLALRTRTSPPQYVGGKLTDEAGDEAHALWRKLGGTETAWAAWSAPTAAPNAAKADEARWEKPTKPLPEFKLADLSGKTWTVESLNGKVVLINLWATWCGPCNAELPQLQKLYEQAKGRSDLQILTFNIDEDLGLVEPFMKEKGYSFPVVPAYSYVVNLLNGYAIPQNWVLNPKGSWAWTQVGYGSDDAWVKDMLAKLDAVKAGG